jgi:hypothetical protein
VLKIFSRAVRLIGKLLWWGMDTFHKRPYQVELQVKASAIKGGKPVDMEKLGAQTLKIINREES